MPILPAGNHRRTQPTGEHGFTLVEVLVTLVIMGLMTGAVIMNLPEGENPALVQGRKMATQLNMIAQSSMISRQSLGVRLRDGHMETVRYQQGEWQVVQDIPIDESVFSTFDFIQNGAKIDLRRAAKTQIPLIRYDVTGLATPFELRLENGEGSFQLIGEIDGRVQLVVGDP